MKHWLIPALTAAFIGTMAFPQGARAEDDALAKEESSLEKTKDRPEWQSALKTQYKLSDEQIKSMQDKGLSYPQMAMAAALAEKSGKPLDEVLKMRTEGHMGWGKIAKELGVPPKEIGQSVRNLRHEIIEARHEERDEKKEEKREDRMAKQESKREERANKRKH